MPGSVRLHRVESRALRGNRLRDPRVRDVAVYLPESYDREPRRRYPVVYFLTGFTGRGPMAFNVRAWEEPLNAQIDRLRRRRRAVEFVVVAPDCFTKYGGSQYLDSSATGKYETFVVREVVRWADRTFRTIPEARARGVLGKSSGGYGAIVLAMRHPDVFGLCACHSGDMVFEYCYFPDIPRALNCIAKNGGTVRAFLSRFFAAPQKQTKEFMETINLVAMSACYAPNPGSPLGFDVPWDETTGEARPDVWRRYLRWDPVRMAPRLAANLRRLRLLFVDCGTRDEFQLHHGARILSHLLKRLGVRHLHEEFDDGHMNVTYRYDRSLEEFSKVWRRLRLSR